MLFGWHDPVFAKNVDNKIFLIHASHMIDSLILIKPVTQ